MKKLLSQRWIHHEKKRYYHIFISQDLLGDWVVTKSWGGINTAIGRIVHTACFSFDEAENHAKKIISIRKRRGYLLEL